MSGSASRDRPRVATFSFSDSLLGDTSLDPPPPDLTSPAGASLSSYSTAQSGGGLKSFVLIKTGDKSLCLGTIGNDKVCMKTTTECSVSKHQAQKQTIIEDTFFVQDGPNRFFSDLSIPSSQLTKAASERLLLEVQKTTQEWEDFMNEFRILSQDQFPVEKFHLEELLRKTYASQQETAAGEKDDSRPPSATSGNSSAFSFEDVESFEKPVSTDVSERLASVEEYLASTGNVITKELAEVGDRVNQAQTSLSEVVTSLGTSDETGQLTGPQNRTVWSSFADFKRELEHQKQVQSALKQEVEVEIPADFAALASTEETNWRNLSSQLQAVRAQDAATIQALTARVQALEQGQGGQQQGSVLPVSRRQRNVSVNPGFPLATQATSPSFLGTQPSPPPSQVAHASTSPALSSMAQTVSDLRIEMDDMKSSFIALRAQITNLEGRLAQDAQEGERIKFGGLGFENLDDAHLFVVDQRKNGSEQVGFLVDIYLLCNMIFRHVGGDYDFLKTSETINKLDLKSNRAAQALVAFQSPIPELFNDPSKSGDVWTQSAKDRSCFSRFKTHDEWTSGQIMIREKMGRVLTGTREQLNAKFPQPSRVKALYELSLSESALCLGNLLQFIDQQISELKNFGMTTARAYALGTKLGDAFFRECHKKVRASVSDDLEAKNSRQVATALWFAVPKTLDVMMSFKASFNEHPAIASEYLKFIVHNTVRDQSETDLIDRMDTYDSKLRELEKTKSTATDAKKLADTAKKMADTHASKIANAAKDAKDALKAHDTLKSKLTDKGVL
eukprot:scaffold9703_cov83-Cylindrotheca_fusiformis.AAC.3